MVTLVIYTLIIFGQIVFMGEKLLKQLYNLCQTLMRLSLT